VEDVDLAREEVLLLDGGLREPLDGAPAAGDVGISVGIARGERGRDRAFERDRRARRGLPTGTRERAERSERRRAEEDDEGEEPSQHEGPPGGSRLSRERRGERRPDSPPRRSEGQ